MKFSLDSGRLHIRLIVGAGFALFLIKKAIKRYDGGAAKAFGILSKKIKKQLKIYKKIYGRLQLLEIEDKDGVRIGLKY